MEYTESEIRAGLKAHAHVTAIACQLAANRGFLERTPPEGAFDGWEHDVDSDYVSAYFSESDAYGGMDHTTISFPLSYAWTWNYQELDVAVYAAESAKAVAEAMAKFEAAKREREERELAEEKATYARLKAKFES